MKVQIVNDIILAYGTHLYGDDVYNAPDDYAYDNYNYIPKKPGVYDISNFVKIINNE